MFASDGNGLATTRGGSRALRRRGSPAAALFSLALIFCLFGPVAAARADAPASTARASLARLALQQAELTAAGSAAPMHFGCSVAISGDTALVGADGMGREQRPGRVGAAYVFVRSGGVWTQQQELKAADTARDDRFGTAVALVGDTALVGAPYHKVAGKRPAGAAYVFVRSAGGWTQQQELKAADTARDDRFGMSVALSEDSALVGAPGRSVLGEPDVGAAHVFVRSGGVWTQQQVLRPEGVVERWPYFGQTVALDGDTALVGEGGSLGAACVFVRSGGVWTQQQRLTPGAGSAGTGFGWSAVALSGDTAVVGAMYCNVAGKREAGAAYVFARAAGVWTQQQKLTDADRMRWDHFGTGVALSGDTALIGAPWDFGQGKHATGGAAYLFTRSGGIWTQRQQLKAADTASGYFFGGSVALAGNAALISASGHPFAGTQKYGAAYVFTLDAAPTSKSAAIKSMESVGSLLQACLPQFVPPS